jgi:hypothetical protein
MIFIVSRSLGDLEGLLDDPTQQMRQDRSIVPAAMANYIQIARALPAMPTIRAAAGGEYLTDGRNFLRALRLAHWTSDVPCVWRGDHPPPGAVPFDATLAAGFGSDLRAIAFAVPPDPKQMHELETAWANPPRQFDATTYGWTEEDARVLPDWLTWMQQLEKLSPILPPIVAINGRYAPF